MTLPAWILGALIAVVGLPLWLTLAVLTDALRGRRSGPTVRAVAFAATYLVCESLGLLAAALLWLARPALDSDSWLRAHYRLQGAWASALFASARRLYGLRVVVEGDESFGDGPHVVLMRHSSLVDTLLPTVFLARRHDLRLRYVMKHELLLDPCLDVVGQRLPNAFVRRGSSDPKREAARLERLARELGAREGVLIYPEGTRFTAAARERAFERLEQRADPRLGQARALRHLLPPRSTGTLALLDAAPEADLIVFGHSGFEGLSGLRQLLAGDLIGRSIRIRLARVAREDVPGDRDGRLDWLWARWAELDAWLAAAPPAP